MTGYSVLTGDIIASSDLGAEELDDVMQTLDAAAKEISGWGGDRLTGFARRGGDGWQAVVQGSMFWFRAAIYMQAALRRHSPAIQTRIAVAESDQPLSPIAGHDPNAGHGPAFTSSGRHLGELTGKVLMGHASGGAKAAAIRLADEVIRGWTQAQARTLCEALHPSAGTRAAIAGDLGISREAVNQALWSSGYLALRDAIKLLEDEAVAGQQE